MTDPIRVVQFGLGPIGRACASALLEKESGGGVILVGAVDIHPALSGARLADVLGDSDAQTDLVVSDQAASVLRDVRPQVVLHATGSFLSRVYDQIEVCLDAGASVISSTEELFYPYDRHPELAESLDQLARERGVSILATGVNPGFAMDVLALAVSGVCLEIESIRIARVVDAAMRREPLQRKIGAGLTPEEFDRRKASGTFGHIGLRESALFVARGLGWRLQAIEEWLEAVIAEEDVETAYLSVKRGQVAGIHHRLVGSASGAPLLDLDLKMVVGASDPYDSVIIHGTPPVDLLIRNGIFGDAATVAALVNAVPAIVGAPPGLRLSMDLPVLRAFGTRAARTA